MGIHGLMKLISEEAPESIKEVDLASLTGMYPCLSVCMYVCMHGSHYCISLSSPIPLLYLPILSHPIIVSPYPLPSSLYVFVRVVVFMLLFSSFFYQCHVSILLTFVYS